MFPPKSKKPTPGLPEVEPMEKQSKPPMKAAPKPKLEPAPEDLAHEQGESQMDFGMIGEKFGLSPEESKAFAYDVLEACMKATGGGMHEETEPEVEDVNESDTENYPA